MKKIILILSVALICLSVKAQQRTKFVIVPISDNKAEINIPSTNKKLTFSANINYNKVCQEGLKNGYKLCTKADAEKFFSTYNFPGTHGEAIIVTEPISSKDLQEVYRLYWYTDYETNEIKIVKEKGDIDEYSAFKSTYPTERIFVFLSK